MVVEDIVRDVIRYRSYFDASGGGVTLSGREPILHMEFISHLIKRQKEKGVYTLLQTYISPPLFCIYNIYQL